MSEITRQVLEAVAAKRGIPVTELDPLYDVIDPDALDALFESIPPEQPLIVRFQYEGFTVVITDGGEVDLTELPDPSSGDRIGGMT